MPPATGPSLASYTLAVSGAFVGSIPTTTRTLSGTVLPGSYTFSVTATNACGTSAATTPQTVTVP
jgi:PKD repeat protein